ncbi:hypothetical protein CC1G_11207 [Coprinopsis cinerea okayama7|uniref:Chromo domain-containing protein n=1 Tax=Coprinopsis cinerea (strain Okayama-7 / 130 / ATCC MYA-4618 / FGSC 9003) TaxID=240176 RepID=A8NJU0_COPC7|nr:hypothetical protein CC1G_11207 [Coprinopsis cinerea okayama7\|eukprot:XP_001834294.2 hypothetical protein CC1G_11207 [Coprinopsis cinerea okayama7\
MESNLSQPSLLTRSGDLLLNGKRLMTDAGLANPLRTCLHVLICPQSRSQNLIFWNRWTEDPILQKYFFCNTFRVLDKVCQYLIEHVIEKGSQEPIEVVFRVTLFNTFTKISTWERLQSELGPLTWASYNREKYIAVLDQLRSENQALYTAAFIKPAPHFGFKENHINHLCLLENLMENEMPYKLLGAKTMADVYEYLISFPGMGDFTTYQLMLNLSYTNVLNFHRNDFTIAGLGAISGLNKMFGRSFSEAYADDKGFAEQVLRYLAEAQDEHFQRLGLEFSGLGPEKLGMDLSDIEHTVCEVDKYCRKAHPQLKAKRMTIKHEYKPVTTPSGIPVPYPKEPILPKAWSHPARKIPNVRPGPLTIEKRYEVDKLTDDKVDEQGRRLFFVHWVGYSLKDATWEFEQSLLQDAPRVVHEYMAAKTAGKQKNANKRRKLK